MERPVGIMIAGPTDINLRRAANKLRDISLTVRPYTGSMPSACKCCGMSVWIGPHQQIWMKANPDFEFRPLCPWCMLAHVQKVTDDVVAHVRLGNTENISKDFYDGTH